MASFGDRRARSERWPNESCKAKEREETEVGQGPEQDHGVGREWGRVSPSGGVRKSDRFGDQEQLIQPDMLGAELIGWLAEVPGKLGHSTQVKPGGGGRIAPDLEILQHPLSKWGHDENSFRCDDTTKTQSAGEGLAPQSYTTCRRLSSRVLNAVPPPAPHVIQLFGDDTSMRI